MGQLVESKRETSRLSNFIEGVKAGFPIAVGYVPIAITFGLVCKSAGIPAFIGVAMSILIYAGASQFLGVNLIAAGASSVEIVLTTLILNFRHFLMTSSLSQKIDNKISKKFLSVIAFGITDETFAVASMRKENNINSCLMLGLNLTAYSSWVLGTALGMLIGDALPNSLKSSMGIALYSMFVGLLVPSLKKASPVITVVLISAATNCIIKWVPLFSFISMGWSIIISAIIAALIGALLYPVHKAERMEG